jgi:hypothetical protein
MLTSAILAIRRINQFYGRPTMYTDVFGRSVFERLECECDYEITAPWPADISKELWMYQKLKTYEAQSEPYIHFDLDFIVHQRFPKTYLQEPGGFQNIEEIGLGLNHVYLFEPHEALVLPKVFSKYDLMKVPAYNVGFLFFNDLEFSREYARTAIEMCVQNTSRIDSFPKEPEKYLTCIIEQQLLGLMAHDRSAGLQPFIGPRESRLNSYFDHYIGNFKNTWRTKTFLKQFVTTEIQTIAAELDELRKVSKA